MTTIQVDLAVASLHPGNRPAQFVEAAGTLFVTGIVAEAVVETVFEGQVLAIVEYPVVAGFDWGVPAIVADSVKGLVTN